MSKGGSVPYASVCYISTAPDFERPLGFEPRHLTRFAWMDQALGARSDSRRRRRRKERSALARLSSGKFTEGFGTADLINARSLIGELER
jgi:hypothetical protein